MCMRKDDEKTEAFRKKKAGKTITVWKVYLVRENMLYSPVYGNNAFSWGDIVSDREKINRDSWDNRYTDPDNEKYTIVNRGIHVFLSRKSARGYREKGYDDFIFKCTAKIDDFVAVDEHLERAVFMKIHLSKKEFKRGIKGRN